MNQPVDLRPTFDFLKLLQVNNNREWFNANKSLYEGSHANIIAYAERLLACLQIHDQIETPSGKKSVFRIYRDIRFSKDKTPYKNNWGGGFRRASEALRGGYYFQIQPGNTFVAGGFWGPNAQDLLHIRKHIAQDSSEIRQIIEDAQFQKTFKKLRGSQLKSAPKGFDKEHPDIDLLRYKQFIVRHDFNDKEVLQPDIMLKMDNAFQQMRPFFNYMSEILTTDLNGTPILQL